MVIPTFDREGRSVATCDLQGRVTFHAVPSGEELGTLIPTTPLRVMQIRFSRGGSKLWLLAISGRIWEWDLAGLRGELAPLGLDWK